MMNREDLEKYKRDLESLEKRLEKELKETPSIIDYGDNVDQEEEEADESIAADEQAGIRDEIRSRIEDVRVALNKMDSGKYGICEECGNPIEKEVLNIVPESRLCKTHKLAK
jgi:RNA polymerase-binding transcription factor DksA